MEILQLVDSKQNHRPSEIFQVEVLRLVTAPLTSLAKIIKAYRRQYIIEDVLKEMRNRRIEMRGVGGQCIFGQVQKSKCMGFIALLLS